MPSYFTGLLVVFPQCSVTCGYGTESRSVYCVKLIQSGLQVNVSDVQCLGPKPPGTRQCHFGECYKLQQLPQIKEHKGTFIQVKRTKKIRLLVGETAVILPNQSVKIKCPVKNFNRKLIFWSKDYRLIPRLGRVRTSSNGALKITRANPKLDAGKYTCSANMLHSTVTVSFHSKRDAKEKEAEILDTIFSENFNYSSQFNETLNDSAINRPQSDRASGIFKMKNTKYFHVNDIKDSNAVYDYSSFTTSQWSECSQKCGSGTQTRKVTCNHVTDKYIRLLPEEECERKGLSKPPTSRKCVMECANWVASEWSEVNDFCNFFSSRPEIRMCGCRRMSAAF